MRRKWLQRSLGVVLVVAVLGAAALLWQDYLERADLGRITGDWLRQLSLGVRVQALSGTGPPLNLPRGNIRDLYRWIQAREQVSVPPRRLPYIGGRDDEVGTFRDVWGNELMWRFPSTSKEVIYDLYSVGPNGKDEGGTGDDVSRRDRAMLAAWREEFEGGIVDPDWVRAHLGDLKRAPSGKIIGAPPERLKEVEDRRDAEEK